MADEKIIYRLILTCAGPSWRENFSVQDEDPAELRPQYVENQNLVYERYGNADDYIEIRMDCIIARDYKVITVKPEKLGDKTDIDEPRPLSSMTRDGQEGQR